MNATAAILQHLLNEASSLLKHQQLNQYLVLLSNDITKLCHQHRQLLDKWYLVSKMHLLPEEELVHICRAYKHLIKFDSLRLTPLPKHVIGLIERKILLALMVYHIKLDNSQHTIDTYGRLKYYILTGRDDGSQQTAAKREITVKSTNPSLKRNNPGKN